MSFRQVREVRKRTHRGGKIFTALLVIGAIVAGSWYVFGRGGDTRTVHADFAFVNGLYQGSTVTVLGVPVGHIDKVDARGDHVRLTMKVRRDVTLPAGVEAFVLNPSVISDRHLELGPAYTTGKTFADGGVIPQNRTHSPISWDNLMESVKTLTQVMGPGPDSDGTGGGSEGLGALLSRTAKSWEGRGPEFGTAMNTLASASGVFGARGDDIDDLIDSLDLMMTTFRNKQVSLDGLIRSMSVLSDKWAEADTDITTPINDLRTVFDQINNFVLRHGGDVGVVAENLDTLGKTLVDNKAGLAEFMDLAPLMMQNLSGAVGPDRRGRIRLNVSTTLTQFKTLKPLCDQFPMPICVGAGLTNPISFPISASDPLGIVSAISGGALPNKPGGR
ncbi:MCE family protein [Gordonia pseudamarae]|jgi:phospholipid/cholesterol/gamma-HCH transport system substrate-binding protein|uniref:MCE family protein n=1 Tax=Gordonia pseudamarae TaxID=2831662 RepID=A0ABX6IF98_9ACTN|nr:MULTISPECIES: MCE family protein [Gordonia]MBD0023379.1 MCE family protein [Gordonia sp. (in: high G+C Gram-positive bacteria)]QHN25584.1 MCE family protein [Gordonia pseudamarae]QHN34515.1 MCE family protein [Gordonia pseudamarae]